MSKKRQKRGIESLEKQIENMRDNFTNMVVHELRAPLVSIKGTVTLLSRSTLGKEDADKMFEILKESANTMLEEVGQLLDAAKIDAGRFIIIKDLADINEVVKEALPELLSICNVIHQSGDHSKFNDYDQLEMIYKEVGGLANGKLYLRKFVMDDEIGEAFNKASVVVSRSGAHTITELLALEKPCVLIPIPWVSHNEQKENALILQKYGLAEILEEKDLNEGSLFASVTKVLGHLQNYKLNDGGAASAVNLKAPEIIAYETYELADKLAQSNTK